MSLMKGLCIQLELSLSLSHEEGIDIMLGKDAFLLQNKQLVEVVIVLDET